jgi:histidyl-tRNA synthetase
MSKPSIPQGTRDFSAEAVRRRQFIFNTIREIFELYGFEPLETPAIENIDTLLGKYGDEGDKLIFKILNNGLDRPEKHEKAKFDFEAVLAGKNIAGITERALRYDLTIPFARYVAMKHGQLTFPFKRYQMQPVWRADRPQKGRYREFYQCDADVVGSTSLINELDLVHIYATVFKKLRIPVEIRINSRMILAALAEACGAPELLSDITIAIDKIDKTGIEKVKDELAERGLSSNQISIIEKYLAISGNSDEKIKSISSLLGGNSLAAKGIEDLTFILERFSQEGKNVTILPDFTLARGLNYYTGIIFEVKALGVQIGSIGGGGRYDNLTGLFGVPNIAGVGISFGVDRIYDVMESLDIFPKEIEVGTQVLFFNLGIEESAIAYNNMSNLRSKGIKSELYPENVKMDKQFKYAEKKQIPYALIIGKKEIDTETCNIKNLKTGTQDTVALTELADYLQHKLGNPKIS